MNKNGPIMFVDDDDDDREMFETVLKNIHCENAFLPFPNGIKALEYLEQSSERPFLIFSDLNMSMMGGLELREKLRSHDDYTLHCIPCLFFTTFAGNQTLTDAYARSVQGFFFKPASFAELETIIRTTLNYWRMSAVAPSLN